MLAGADLLRAEWEAFSPTTNELIKIVLLEEESAVQRNYQGSQFCSDGRRYAIESAYEFEIVVIEQDYEIELMFVIAYQKISTCTI